MTFWNRAPREVCRVYGEAEYLAEGEAAMGETRSDGSLGGESSGRRRIGLGSLALVLLSVLAVSWSEARHSHSKARLAATSSRAERLQSSHAFVPKRPRGVVVSRGAPRRRLARTGRLAKRGSPVGRERTVEVEPQRREPSVSAGSESDDEFGFER